MSNEERFWESSIAEAVTGDAPPDVASRVLTQLADETAEPKPKPEPPRRDRLVRIVVRYGLELGAAAAVVIAFAWLTGLVKFDDGGSDTQTDATDPMIYAASPDAVVKEEDNFLELEQGWLLVTTGSPDVHCDGSILTNVDGRVLLHAGSMPSREQAEAVKHWLKANNVETDMIVNSRHWAATATLAALVLSGSALLDGTRIEAQDPPEAGTARWHTVRTVMDIDKLPEDAKFIRGEGVSGAHLEFLAKHSTVEAIDFRQCEGLRAEHIRTLSDMKNLKLLDVRKAVWDEEPDYEAFLGLDSLTELAVDYMPWLDEEPEVWPFEGWESSYLVLDSLGTLSKRGVRITLGNMEGLNAADLEELTEQVLTIRELDLKDCHWLTDADMKSISNLPMLQSLNLEGCIEVSELGLAYLVNATNLNSLVATASLTDANLYQFAQMKELKYLALPYGVKGYYESSETRSDALERALATFSKMPELTHLVIPHSDAAEPALLATLDSAPKLHALTLVGDWNIKSVETLTALAVPSYVGVKRFECAAPEALLILPKDKLAEDGLAKLASGVKGSEILEEIQLSLMNPFRGTFVDGTVEVELAILELLERFPNLKRVEFVTNEAYLLPKFQQYVEKYFDAYTTEIRVEDQ